MFTIKAYEGGFRQVIMEAESFTILHGNQGGTDVRSRAWAEITLHKGDGGLRIDVGDSPERDRSDSPVRCYDRVIIENSQGKTCEMIDYRFQRAA